MSQANDPERLQKQMGYRFRDQELLRRALTHSSYANENSGADRRIPDNERLEFLGDAVLGLLVSHELFSSSRADEGKLTRAKSHLVSARTLSVIARRLDLGAYLLLGRGEELDGGRDKQSLLANSMEAVIGAVYVDGGIRSARALVRRLYKDVIASGEFDTELMIRDDPKSYLQELLQARDLPPPVYKVSGEEGPDHNKDFTVEVALPLGRRCSGVGKSKKSAEQSAAARALELIESGELELPPPARSDRA